MGVSYNKLWKLLIDKKMSSADLRKAADIAPNTLTRMKRDQEVTIQVLERICDVLDVDFRDIVEHVPNADEEIQIDNRLNRLKCLIVFLILVEIVEIINNDRHLAYLSLYE